MMMNTVLSESKSIAFLPGRITGRLFPVLAVLETAVDIVNCVDRSLTRKQMVEHHKAMSVSKLKDQEELLNLIKMIGDEISDKKLNESMILFSDMICQSCEAGLQRITDLKKYPGR